MSFSCLCSVPLLLSLIPSGPEQPDPSAVEASRPTPIRAGMIGLDTSHVVAFAEILNDPEAAEDVANCKVVAAFPPGSKLDFNLRRRKGYTEKLAGMGVEMVSSVPELLDRVDVVMVMTNDGRPHLEQSVPVLKAGKPLFVDKPLAGTLEDAFALAGLAAELEVPFFTASALRFAPGAQAVRKGGLGEVLGADAYSPCELESHHPDLFWYGIHGVELLYTAMGPGCEQVIRATSERSEVVIGNWPEGRFGTFRGLRRGKTGYGGTAFGRDAIGALGPFTGYRPLVVEIVRFFRTGESPVAVEESLEIYTFMEAADESKRRGGEPVKLAEVAEAAREKAGKMIEKLKR